MGKNDVEIVKHKGAFVTLDNAFIRAGHGLTLNEKRIIMMALSQNKTKNSPPIQTVIIYAKDFADQFGVDPKNAYTILQEAGEQLYQRSISWSTDTALIKQRWLERAKYEDKEGYISLSWASLIMPYLFRITRNFTSYRLSQASALRSIHSWKLLELIEQFRTTTGYIVLDIDELHNIFELSENQRKDFAKCRVIINNSIKELKEKEGHKITYEAVKRGRKVSQITFKVARNLEPRLI